ncbi:MAG: AAA family ATPase [Byssovorax sp.]
MLVQFLVENFLSFKDETVFSMRAPPGETAAVIDIPGHDGLRLMRVAAFYGANASGKSNLIAALRTARQMIRSGGSANVQLPDRPFRLSPDSQVSPTRFQLDFLIDDTLYSHTLIFDAATITGEALYRTLPHTADEELVYERDAPPRGGEHSVAFGPMMMSGDAETQQFARFVVKAAPVQQPLLTELATRNVPGFAPIYDWVSRSMAVVGPSDSYRNLVSDLAEDSSLRVFYGHMLSAMGTGVNGVKVLDDDDVNVPSLILEHTTRSGSTVMFPLEEESDGTQRLLHLLPVLFHGTKGPCTVIDELDRSLHTALTRRFVEEFMSMASGAMSQLIFTTHDTNLLNGRLLPPASIWFVEKDDDGASHLHSLADYRAPQIEHLLEHLEEGYLQGRFGAIPFLAHRENLGWQSGEPAA